MGKGMTEGSWVRHLSSQDEGEFMGGDDEKDFEGVQLSIHALTNHLGFSPHSSEWWWIMEKKYSDRNGVDMVLRVIFTDGGGGEAMLAIENTHTGNGMNFGFIHYVHELQSFFLAISGKELKYV